MKVYVVEPHHDLRRQEEALFVPQEKYVTSLKCAPRKSFTFSTLYHAIPKYRSELSLNVPCTYITDSPVAKIPALLTSQVPWLILGL